MPRFSGQILSRDGDVIASNADILINFFQIGSLTYWSGSFSLPRLPQFEPQKGSFNIQLSDGRKGTISIKEFTMDSRTSEWHIQFENDGPLE